MHDSQNRILLTTHFGVFFCFWNFVFLETCQRSTSLELFCSGFYSLDPFGAELWKMLTLSFDNFIINLDDELFPKVQFWTDKRIKCLLIVIHVLMLTYLLDAKSWIIVALIRNFFTYLSEHMHRCKMLNKSMFSCMHCTNREMHTSHCLLYIMNF